MAQFPSLIGSIKSSGRKRRLAQALLFPSLIGSIKSVLKNYLVGKFYQVSIPYRKYKKKEPEDSICFKFLFPSLIGSIKSSMRSSKIAGLSGFHPL